MHSFLKHLDISGTGHAGKGAITDLLREFSGFSVPNHLYEFNLLRIPGGLLDVRQAIHDEWSLIRSNAAYDRFDKLIARLGHSPSELNFRALWNSTGANYNSYFDSQFMDISRQYLKSLPIGSAKSSWPYEFQSPAILNAKRALRRLGLNIADEKKIYLLPPDGFLDKTRKYLDRLFRAAGNKDAIYSVSHNAFDFSSIARCIDLFGDARSILVFRDPRDIYASSLLAAGYQPSYEKKKGIWKQKQSFLMAGDLDLFIARQSLINDAVKDVSNSRVLFLWYEDLILNYEDSIKAIADFLEIDLQKVHTKKQAYFDPEKSIANIGLWKSFPEQPIHEIKARLPTMLYPE